MLVFNRHIDDLPIKHVRLTPADKQMPMPGFPDLPTGLWWHLYYDNEGGRFVGFVDRDGWIQRGVRVEDDESLVQAARRCELRLAEL